MLNVCGVVYFHLFVSSSEIMEQINKCFVFISKYRSQKVSINDYVRIAFRSYPATFTVVNKYNKLVLYSSNVYCIVVMYSSAAV